MQHEFSRQHLQCLHQHKKSIKNFVPLGVIRIWRRGTKARVNSDSKSGSEKFVMRKIHVQLPANERMKISLNRNRNGFLRNRT